MVLSPPHSVYLLLKDWLAYDCRFFPKVGVLQRREAYNKSLLYDIEGVKAALVPEAANGGHWFFWESTFLCLAAWALSGLHQQTQAAIFPLWGPSLELN